jgi:hypothetical protein
MGMICAGLVTATSMSDFAGLAAGAGEVLGTVIVGALAKSTPGLTAALAAVPLGYCNPGAAVQAQSVRTTATVDASPYFLNSSRTADVGFFTIPPMPFIDPVFSRQLSIGGMRLL